MNMHKNFETVLPDGYSEAKIVDAKNIKFGVIMNLVALIPPIIALYIIYRVYWVNERFGEVSQTTLALYLVVFVLVNIAYMVLHELVHGAAYKLLTGQKLTFGLTLTVAYCGVPDIYVYRKAAMISVSAPFVVFTVVFTLLTLIVPTPLLKSFSALMLAVHIGGCSGDLYDILLYLIRFRKSDVLMRDTGPKQVFYVK